MTLKQIWKTRVKTLWHLDVQLGDIVKGVNLQPFSIRPICQDLILNW